MTTKPGAAPSYGVLEQRAVTTDLEIAAEEITCRGYSVVDSGYSANEITEIARLFDATHDRYVELYSKDVLTELDEYNGIRLPLALNERFIDLAANRRVLDLVGKLIRNQFILNQQNGIINPPGGAYNQAAWHRDLPYQHFVTSRPLAVNALYCVDDFTLQNGATLVVPGSHAQEQFPSDSFVKSNAKQITASAGSFIVLDGMLFHKGGPNNTSSRRRAVNHLYTRAFIKQQIDIPSVLAGRTALAPAVAELFGFKYQISRTVADFLKSRRR